ncbi:Major Facilitator Superfamily [Geosmithia morbida]|uniref:Major Facilitator Superfamily n=1 Tax=Geosmithia morbida TaxID=1094350 RepID=A0A9P5CXN5_9HYPO|nr:Major Facilitator Superfamily [Geosmithia morbida]KAF4119478.1 Major Facilitator Superfamily [Geosmithia morbida]
MPNIETRDGTELWPPGTVYLEKANATGRGKGKIVLQPRPSRDVNDPLNWSTRRKYWNFALVCFYVSMVAECINAPTPTWGPMNKELGFSYEILNDSYAAGCAALGVGSIFMIPFALNYGRRPLYIITAAIQCGVSVWSAKLQTPADIIAFNVVQCFVASLAEAIVQMTIADVFFLHQRGRMNAIYVWTWLLASNLGTLIAGFITAAQGWRWIWWWNSVVFGFSILLFYFGYEETRFVPPAVASVDPVLADSVDKTDVGEDAKTSSAGTKFVINGKDEAPEGTSSDFLGDLESSNHASPQTDFDPAIPKKTYWQKLSIIDRASVSSSISVSVIIQQMLQPFAILFTIPAVGHVALVYGILVGLGDVMSTTMSSFLPEPPYNWSSDSIGLMSVPKMIGVTLGAVVVGPLSDWWIIYKSRRNDGVYHPEMRLWCVIPFLLFVPAGALLFGIGLSEHLSWLSIAVGLGLYNFGIAPINSIAITYLTDSYKDIIGPALVSVTVIRNVFSTSFIFALDPWEAKIGLKYVLVTILLIVCVILSGFGAFIRYGRKFREKTVTRYEYYAKNNSHGKERRS